MSAHDHPALVPGCARCELSVDEAIAAATAAPTPDRLGEIKARLAHENEPCCDHSGRDEHGCWDCRNTGHAHAPYVEGEAKDDLAALVKFAREVAALHKPHKVLCLNPFHGADCDANTCDTCDTAWPCPTFAAVQRLGDAS